MTVQELMNDLAHHDPKREVRFTTGPGCSLTIGAIYAGNSRLALSAEPDGADHSRLVWIDLDEVTG